MLADSLAIVAFVIVAAAGLEWYRRMQAVTIPSDRRAFIAASVAALALGVTSLALAPATAGKVLAWIAILGGSTFVVLNLLSGQEARQAAARVGEPLPVFSGIDEAGAPFDSASTHGRPLLLKFFRGHW